VRRATFIVNPRAGRARELAKAVPALMRVLAGHGITGEMVETAGPKDGTECSRRAVEAGSEMVFACGGDGTVHEVLQGLVHTPGVLGVLPVGTANALARNLGLSLDPVAAVTQQMGFQARKIAVGEICFQDSESGSLDDERRRYFTVMAGAGPDGALVYSLLAGDKAVMGRSAYYAHAARLFFTRRFRPFRVRYRVTGAAEWQEIVAASVMGVRVADLGGAFGRLTPGASLHDVTLRLVMVKPPGLVSLPAWFALGRLGLHARNPWLEMLAVEEFECKAINGDRVHAQVDGEWIGGLPLKVRMIPDAVSLLMPYSGLSCGD
jgi:YegS/Rv2252/BmrU family lipid kinase